jgi:hypothetical protein
MATCVLGEQSKKKLETVQLSNDTVKSHSRFVSRYRKKNLVSRLKSSFAFSLQLGESTDVSGLAVLLVFVFALFQKTNTGRCTALKLFKVARLEKKCLMS